MANGSYHTELSGLRADARLYDFRGIFFRAAQSRDNANPIRMPRGMVRCSIYPGNNLTVINNQHCTELRIMIIRAEGQGMCSKKEMNLRYQWHLLAMFWQCRGICWHRLRKCTISYGTIIRFFLAVPEEAVIIEGCTYLCGEDIPRGTSPGIPCHV
jgi:hypothetical protein